MNKYRTPTSEHPEMQQGSESVLASWSAPIKPSHERSKRWYITAAVVVVAVIGITLLLEIWTLASVTVLFSIVYWFTHRSPPPVKTITIRTKSCSLGDETVPWTECAGFWMLECSDYAELRIERKNKRKDDIVIQTGSMNPYEIHAVMHQVLPEFYGRGDRLLDRFARFCKI